MQSVQKTLTQYGVTRQTQEGTEEHMTLDTDPAQMDSAAELTSIKTLLQGISSSMRGLKSGMDAVQTAVEKLESQVTEAENRVSALEDQDQSLSVAVETATKTIAQLQEKVTYLEDAGRRNNVRIVGVVESAEGGDVQRFMRTFLEEALDIEMGPDFEIKRVHKVGQRGNRDRHILVRFLRFGAREAVLRSAREKERVEWRGKRVSFSRTFHRTLSRGAKSLME